MSHLSFEGQDKVSYCLECLPSSTILYTGNSIESIASIGTRHTVKGHTGLTEKVKQTFKRHFFGDLVKLGFYYTNIPLKLTPEHPIFGVRNIREPQTEWRKEGIDETKLEWISAKDFTKKDFVAFPRLNETKDVEIATENLMELLGFYIAEGSFDPCSRGVNVTFSFGRHESFLSAKVAELIERVFGSYPCVTNTESQTAVRVVYSSKYFGSIFEQFGKGALNKTIPEWVLTLPEGKQLRLLKGMFAGDGRITPHMLQYSTSSPKLAYRLRLLLFRLGILHNVSRIRQSPSKIKGRKIHGQKYTFIVTTSGDSARILAQKIGIDYYGGERTTGNFGYVSKNYVFIPVKVVAREQFRGNVYNLHVNDSESYLTIHGALHNCSEKHGQTAKVLLREALERAEAGGANTEGVMEKVRGVVAELTGMEDDTTLNREPTNEAEEQVIELHGEARDIRKEIYVSKCEIGKCEIGQLRDLAQKLDSLVDAVYQARQKYECPGCTTRAKELASGLTHVTDESMSAAERRAEFLREIKRGRK